MFLWGKNNLLEPKLFWPHKFFLKISLPFLFSKHLCRVVTISSLNIWKSWMVMPSGPGVLWWSLNYKAVFSNRYSSIQIFHVFFLLFLISCIFQGACQLCLLIYVCVYVYIYIYIYIYNLLSQSDKFLISDILFSALPFLF